MLCSVYKSSKKEGMYLYISKKDDFSDIPETLLTMFGKPIFVMVMKMEGRKLALVDIDKVRAALIKDGFFLQLPPPPVNLLDEYKSNKSKH